jgi:hypothetical protein
MGNNARTPRERIEFPLRLKSKIIAGKTPVGSAVEGTLVMATLVNGVVIPENAVFTGVIQESVKHEGNAPSRIRVHVTAAKWSGKSMAVELYATGHIYPPFSDKLDPEEIERMRDLFRRGVMAASDPTAPSAPRYDPRRLINKNIRNERSPTGEVVVVSEKSNIEMSGGAVYCFEGSATK